MSVTASSRTKSASRSGSSESMDNPLILDRWSHNIGYRQLVISSCISIVQLWWHPYVHDLKTLVPFLFLYNVFSVLIGYPMFYLELALGVVTKKGVINCWDLAPMARGIGLAMLVTCVFTALAIGAVAAWSLALLVHSFHSFLPWLHCAATAQPACAARHRPLPIGSETPAQSFFFNFVLHLKRNGLEGGMGTIVRELTVYYVISWVMIYCIAVKRVYSYSKVVLFKDVLTYFVIVCCAIGVTRLEGAGRMFQDCDWTVLRDNAQIYREAIEYALFQITVSQGSLVMLGTYCPKQQHLLARTSVLSFAASKSSSMAVALTLGGAHGALQRDYDNYTNIWAGPSSSLVLWADYVARVPGSQFWSALVFFTIFLQALSTAALLVQTIMSTLTGRSIRKIAWAFLVMTCVLFCLIGIMTVCTQGGLYVQSFLMRWPVTRTRLPIAALVAMVVTYLYGQTTFCEDVYFAIGEYPCMALRVSWAIMPGIMLGMFIMGMSVSAPLEVTGFVIVVIALLPIGVFMLLYFVFKCRVRNIVGTEK